MQRGVGTNRYSYSFNDPVNGKDASGHLCTICDPGGLGSLFDKIFGGPRGTHLDAVANAKGTGEQMKASAKEAAAKAVKTAFDLSPAGTVSDLLETLSGGRYGAAALAALGLVPGERIVGRVLGIVSGTGKAAVTLDRAASAAKLTKIGETGKVGEEALKSLGGASQVGFPTRTGRRVVDQLADGVANESKVGRTSLTQPVRKQIAKDVELLEKDIVKGVNWHSFQSPVTGLGGFTGPLERALSDAGIGIVYH